MLNNRADWNDSGNSADCCNCCFAGCSADCSGSADGSAANWSGCCSCYFVADYLSYCSFLSLLSSIVSPTYEVLFERRIEF